MSEESELMYQALSQDVRSIALVGKYATSKSSTMNCLVGLDIFPTSPSNCTRCIVIIMNYECEDPILAKLNVSQKKLERIASGKSDVRSTLAKLNNQEFETIYDCVFVVAVKIQLFKEYPSLDSSKIVFIDLPGLNKFGDKIFSANLIDTLSPDSIIYFNRTDLLEDNDNIDILQRSCKYIERKSDFSNLLVVMTYSDRNSNPNSLSSFKERLENQINNVFGCKSNKSPLTCEFSAKYYSEEIREYEHLKPISDIPATYNEICSNGHSNIESWDIYTEQIRCLAGSIAQSDDNVAINSEYEKLINDKMAPEAFVFEYKRLLKLISSKKDFEKSKFNSLKHLISEMILNQSNLNGPSICNILYSNYQNKTKRDSEIYQLKQDYSNLCEFKKNFNSYSDDEFNRKMKEISTLTDLNIESVSEKEEIISAKLTRPYWIKCIFIIFSCLIAAPIYILTVHRVLFSEKNNTLGQKFSYVCAAFGILWSFYYLIKERKRVRLLDKSKLREAAISNASEKIQAKLVILQKESK